MAQPLSRACADASSKAANMCRYPVGLIAQLLNGNGCARMCSCEETLSKREQRKYAPLVCIVNRTTFHRFSVFIDIINSTTLGLYS